MPAALAAPVHTVRELARRVGGEVSSGDPDRVVRRVMPLDRALEDAVAFVAKAEYLPLLAQARCAAVLISPALRAKAPPLPAGLAVITVASPYLAFARVAQALAPPPARPTGVHPSAVVEATAELGAGVALGPFVYVGPRARVAEGAVLHAGVHLGADAHVGAGSVLYDHVVVRDGCRVGARCVLHPGVVIGSDGFGFAQVETERGVEHLKIPQLGDVVLEDDVEIGANACVDRATLGTTRVGAGTKIDNLVQVGHNVELGRGCLLVAQSGVAGSSVLEDGVVLAAQAGVSGHLRVGRGATIYGQSGVMADVEPGRRVMGSPAVSQAEHFRAVVRLAKLDSLFSRVKKLERLLGRADD